MEWKDLAPWIAIAITLALSIVVPLFTQIANNSHQRKMQKEKLDYESTQEKERMYKEFLRNVGSAAIYPTTSALEKAGESLFQVYLYAPKEWWEDLDNLSTSIRKGDTYNSQLFLQKISKLISEELNKK